VVQIISDSLSIRGEGGGGSARIIGSQVYWPNGVELEKYQDITRLSMEVLLLSVLVLYSKSPELVHVVRLPNEGGAKRYIWKLRRTMEACLLYNRQVRFCLRPVLRTSCQFGFTTA
jgi:hypothetical protein